jgi:hypothetical protein
MKMKVLFTFIALWLCLGGVKVYAQTYIGTEAELRAFATAVNNGTFGTGTAYLIADINLTGSWTPIGNATNQFKGQFEGWGHTISNLNVTGSNDYAGLFGYIDGGSVRDVGIASGGVSGKSCVGGICGYLKAGEISSCYNKTTVSGEDYVGGLCGKSKGTIKNCWHTGNVTATAETSVCAGGLVGCCESGADLLRCYVINTKITVDGITGSNPTNSLFGQVVGEWQGEINVYKLNSCVFNSENVYVDKYEAGDAVLGSYHGSDTYMLTDESVKAATTNRMKTKRFWSGKLNVEGESYIMSGDTKNFYNPNWVFMLTNDDPGNPDDIYDADDPDNPADPDCSNYPQLNSFYSKDKPITFNFSSTKQWLTIVPNGNYAVPEGVEAYKVIGVTGSTAGGGTATLSRVYALYEGCPAMVYSTEGTSKTTDNTKTNPTPPTPLNSKGYSDWQGNNLLQGSPTSPDNIGNDGTTIDDLDASVDYVLQNNAFGRVKNGTIARGKAYLHAPFSAGSKLRFVFADESMTSIDAVEEGLENDAVWYTMDGRKLEGEPTEKGVYVVNGKKVMVQ